MKFNISRTILAMEYQANTPHQKKCMRKLKRLFKKVRTEKCSNNFQANNITP